MSARILDGKKVSAEIYSRLRNETDKLVVKPCMAVVLVGQDPASQVYVRMKQRRCEENGFISIKHELPEETTEQELLELIHRLNSDTTVHGILVQLPLPDHINEFKVIEAVNPRKDVDCFHPYNIGRLAAGNPVFLPCTPAGVMEILSYYNITLDGKNAVVIGRSNIVGKPLSLLLQAKNATVTMCHSKTADLASAIKAADIVFAAVGVPELVKGSMIKEGAVVVDVGINRVAAPETDKGYRLVGDVQFSEAAKVADWITPVPGGVGAMTIAMLLQNCLTAYRVQHE